VDIDVASVALAGNALKFLCYQLHGGKPSLQFRHVFIGNGTMAGPTSHRQMGTGK
jgi:hypothetical protein